MVIDDGPSSFGARRSPCIDAMTALSKGDEVRKGAQHRLFFLR